ncbi:TetR/AcrR family transcriptional regulator [Phenylobacterium sp.]|uniref:TetR/AcrR family transcriptional regulator n=1 Tax=Phenylobacterium sp. TaxID=1871053 RepID=UPI002BACD7BD|nr:TetR/AcrR family transcriptional regulator [Phenylobacterium sp.]HLZ76625.1 TetR/AcrR family transcriptional regulator [Phenylobacterium sp.]
MRRAELIDCAQGLFLTRGYERTTINDVISATGLSKGAFYHHFRAKEDLLEAIAQRFARESLGFIHGLQTDAGLDALQRLNRLLALGRDWKRGHLAELKAMFTTLLKPENAVLYHRIVEAAFAVLAPALASIIAQGEAEGVFDAGDPRTAADTLLWLSNGRRGLVITAMATAETDVDAALKMIVERVRAEEAITNRILGLPPGNVDLLGPETVIQDMLIDWNATSGSGPSPGAKGAPTGVSRMGAEP